MGCGASTEAVPPPSNHHQQHAANGGGRSANPPSAPAAMPKNPYVTSAPGNKSKTDDPQEAYKNAGIDRDLDRAKQQEESKIKLLLLGAGESGKSTVFKQMRILYGSVRNDDEKRMYGVVVRSNIITALRKLCTLLKTLELEDQLAKEPRADEHNGTNMTPKQAYDLIVAHLIEGTTTTTTTTGTDDAFLSPVSDKDWVGTSARAGLAANTDAQQFLQLWRPIKTLWEVRLLLLSSPEFFLFVEWTGMKYAHHARANYCHDHFFVFYRAKQ